VYYFWMKITIKGQVTIPLAMRERFGLRPGTEVEFIPDKDGLRVKPRKGESNEDAFAAWLAKAAGSASTSLSTDECMKVTRGED